MSPSMHVPPDLLEEVARSEATFCREIRHADPLEAATALAAGSEGTVRFLEPFLKRYERPRVLEIGSGNGFGLCRLLLRGHDVVGVEPGARIPFEGRYARAARLLESNGIAARERLVPACGEALPFPDSSFDIVFSIAVLEHVQDVGAVLAEALRVVRADGVVVMNVPDYDAFHEGHYDRFWLPYVLGREDAARWFVRNVLRRPDYYVDELNLTTPRQIRRLLSRLPACGSVEIYPLLQGPLLYLAGGSYYLAIDYPEGHPLLGWLTRRRRLAGAVRRTTSAAVKLLAVLGLAPTFNVVYRKAAATPAPLARATTV